MQAASKNPMKRITVTEAVRIQGSRTRAGVLYRMFSAKKKLSIFGLDWGALCGGGMTTYKNF
jgi:hypothetical protein